MASDFPIMYYSAPERGPMNEYYRPHADATFGFNALVVMDGDEVIDECATDAVSVLGISKGAAADKWLWADTAGVARVPVSVLTHEVEIGMCVGAGTLATTHLNTIVGVVKLASGNWGVDLAETTAAAFLITKVDVTNQIAWGKFTAAVCQFDGVAT